jgi:hypothetical protein
MGATLAEIAILLALVLGLLRLLRPLERRLEAWILDCLIPGRKRIIDAEVCRPKPKPGKE